MNCYMRVTKAFNREKGPDYPEHGKYAGQLSGIGGQYASTIGDSTRDRSDREEHRRRLAEFERELAEVCNNRL